MDDKDALQEEDSLAQLGRSQLRQDLSGIVHKGINEAGNAAPHSAALTSPYYERFSGARMYEHTRTKPIRDGLSQLAGRPLQNAVPTAPSGGPDPQWIRTRPRSTPQGQTSAQTMLGNAGIGLTEIGPGHTPGGPGVVPPGPRPMSPISGNGVPMLALPAGPPATPAQKARMSRNDRKDPGKQAMTRALSGALGDTMPPPGETPWFSR